MCDTPKNETGVSWLGWNDLPDKPQRAGVGPWTDLTYPLSPSVPRSAMFDAPSFTRIARIPDQRANITQMDMVVHIVTHLDAPVHFCVNGPGMEAVPLERLMGEGVVIQLELSACEAITAGHLANAAPTIEQGDIVAIDTGWKTQWETPNWTRHPYLSAEATDWLIDREVKLVAVDSITPDLPYDLRPDEFDFPVHCALLQRGILIAEQLANLDSLSGQRVEFLFGALPIANCDGAPSRVMARALA